MPIAEYPVDSASLVSGRPCSTDVFRSLVQNLIHIYRDRLYCVFSLMPQDDGSGHTPIYSAAASYTKVYQQPHRLSPWANRLKIYGYLVNNGDVAARLRVRYYFGAQVHASISIPAADGDWVGGAGGYYNVTDWTLTLRKIKENNPNVSVGITVAVYCTLGCEAHSLSCFEVHA